MEDRLRGDRSTEEAGHERKGRGWSILRHPTAVSRGQLSFYARVLTHAEDVFSQFGIAVTAHLTVFSLGLVSASLGGTGLDSGWKEI